MTTTTDMNSMIFHSSPRMNNETNNSFMDIDDIHISTMTNGHSHDIEEKETLFHTGNPVLNKSFDVIPQVKDDANTSNDYTKNNNVLDTTVELPNTNDGFEEKSSQDLNILKAVNNIDTPPTNPPLLSHQFSLEYPYELPQREENIQPIPSNTMETLAGLTKNIKLNGNKSIDEPITPTLTNEKPFDTNTFVLKRKERRKIATPANENSFQEENTSDIITKQSPSVTLDVSVPPRSMDPTRIIECVEQYYRILFRVCEYTEEVKQELRLVKNERDQMSEDLINAENAFTDVKKRNEKLKLIINEHKANTETLKRFSEESVRYTEEQKQKYAVLKQHAQEKLNEANGEIERLRRLQSSEIEGIQTQLRFAQLRVQSLEQDLKTAKQELEQKKRENTELTNICDELLSTNRK